jgi:hypothetical protein
MSDKKGQKPIDERRRNQFTLKGFMSILQGKPIEQQKPKRDDGKEKK